jgi:hypothetical protein
LQNNVTRFIKDCIAPNLGDEGTINFFTICKKENTILRADPQFQNKTSWHDWVYMNNITFETNKQIEEKHVPVQIISFLEITGVNAPITGYSNSRNKISIIEDGIYAMVHYIPLPLSYPTLKGNFKSHAAHDKSILMDYSQKVTIKLNYIEQRDITLISMKDFHSTCIAVPDFEATARKKHSFIFLKNKSEWLKLFRDHMKTSILEHEMNDNKKNKKRKR